MPETLQLPNVLRDLTVVPMDGDPSTAYERGLRAGERRLSEQLVQLRAEFTNLQSGLLESLRQSVAHVVRDSERYVIELAVEVAQKLVAGMPVTTEMVEGAIREALTHVEETAEITVLLNADDLALLQKSNSPLLATAAGHPQTHFSAAPEVTRGGCLVQTRFGVIDTRRETKAEVLKRELIG